MQLLNNLIMEEIFRREPQAVVKAIMKTGSQILRSNPSDLDFLVIVNNLSVLYFKIRLEHEGVKYDITVKEESGLEKVLNFGFENIDEIPTVALFNFFLAIPQEIIYGEWDKTWDMISHKETYLWYIKHTYKTTIARAWNRVAFSKHWVYYYIILSIYKNNSTEITQKMKQDIDIIYEAREGFFELSQWVEQEIENI